MINMSLSNVIQKADLKNNVLEKQILEYWKLSDKKRNNFNFHIFITEFLDILTSKLARHGQLSYEEYIKYISIFYDFNTLEQFVYNSKHTNSEWTFKNIQKLIFYPRYEHFRDTFKNNNKYIKLKKLYNKIKMQSYDSMVLLVDECIYSIHNSGTLIDIEKLREEYES